MKLLVLITTTILLLCNNVWSQGLETFDILEPIVKISPARNEEDRFGYSVTAHQLVKLSPEDSFQKALDNTVIMVGAPDGQFPGGISGIEPNGLVCREVYPDLSDDELLALSNSEIWPCYDNITTGLVYTCPLNSGQCGATLGNGNATGPDGLLFDRVGNSEAISGNSEVFHDKNFQLMGKTVYSNGDYFVACAPLWEYVDVNVDGLLLPQPRGRCVYSNRTLTDFLILFPCNEDLGANANNQNGEGFCTTGSSVHFIDDSNVSLAVSTPGRHFSRGGAFYYDLNGTSTIENDIRTPDIFPSRGGEVIQRSTGFQNVYNNLSYYGFAITSGFLTSNITKDFALSAPQRIIGSYLGRVYVVTDFKSLPTIYVEGEQLGEYFGYSLAAIDLNGDGWDDLLVGAPMYSENSRPELGQVYIFLNNEGVFETNTVIIGTAVSGRFGISVECLGDINNDGYEDFAVSAPYEGRGVVYIYHGQQMDVNGTIVNTQYQQRIDGSTMVDRVSDLTDVNLFGFSISGTVDVDNNLYRDLVIGAHESQSVFVLRSIPVATVSISITTDVVEVILDSYDCTDFNGQPVTCFDVVVTGQFVGRGLNSGFSAYYQIREDIQQTVFFNADMQNSITRSISFENENDIFSETLTVYFLNDTSVSGDRGVVTLTVEMLQISRPDVIVDTNLSPSDLSQSPVINSLPDTLNVTVASQCGEDEICDSDLIIDLLNITYLTVSGQEYEDQSRLTVDAVDRVDVSLSFENQGEIAFNAFITFELPRNIFTHRQVLPQSILISCNDTTPQNITHGTYSCNIRSSLSKEVGRTTISLRWQVNVNFQGEQDSVSIPISFMIPTVASNRENSSLLNDNVANVEIDIVAIAEYRFTALFSSDQVAYQGNSTPRVNNIASNLGEDIQLSVTLRNDGPSTIRNATLNIFIPARLESVTRDNYFYYPATLTIRESEAVCDQSMLNPQNYNTDTAKKRRRKRLNRSGPIDHQSLLRMVRQTRFDLDCRQNPELCINLQCNVSELDSSITLEILGYLDERFYDGKSSTYNLRAYATVEILDRFTEAKGPLNTTAELQLIQFRRSSQSSGPPWYVIAVPIVAALLFLIILAVVLYFFGFFRRKKTKDDTDENQVVEDFEQFDTNPFGKSGTGAKEIPQPKGQPELTNFEPVQT